MTILWNIDETITAYDIVVSDKDDFSRTSKNTKEKIFGDVKKKNIVINGLPSGRIFYVKLRAVKIIDGKSYYGVWSKTKAVVVK